METNTQNKKNKNLIIIIIIVAGLIVLAAGAFIAIKYVTREKPAREDVTIDNNVTLLKCNTGKTLNDALLKETEEIIKGVIGNKLISIEKTQGIEPVMGFPEDDDGNEIIVDVGDGILVTFMLLEENEKTDVMTAIANKFDFIHDYGFDFEKTVYIMEFNDIYRVDLK